MNNEKMGQFISDLRKANQMTQKELAAKLNVTDKAVSKWERGLSCPDLPLIPVLAKTLGVTVDELLNGEKNDAASAEVETSVNNVLQYADRAVKVQTKSLLRLCATVFSLLLLVGIVVCSICDLAISGGFTWSLIPISSIVFTWLAVFPVLRFGAKGICGTLIAVSVLIIPFLWVLNGILSGGALLLPIGIWMAAVSVIFLWVIFALFKVLHSKKLIAGSISLLLAIPVCITINAILGSLISEPQFDVWDIVTFSAFIAAAAILFVIDFRKRRKS